MDQHTSDAARATKLEDAAARYRSLSREELLWALDPGESETDRLPFASDQSDGAVSTMTHHEFASARARTELARVLAPGGRLVVGDWSADDASEDGPPPEERFAMPASRSTSGRPVRRRSPWGVSDE